MDRDRIDAILTSCERELTAGELPDLGGTGFWKAVAAMKGNPALVDEFGARTAAIDRTAFRHWALVVVPFGVGTALALVVSAAALALIGLAYAFDEPWNGIALLLGTGVLLVTTHGLGHAVVGTLTGMRFTDWFIGALTRPQPGVKVDYATYLAAPASSRAWMHASGAIVTKAVPFLMLGAAWAMGAPWWTTIVLVAVGAGSILTDVAWSTSSSDWMKFRRERRYARVQSMRPE